MGRVRFRGKLKTHRYNSMLDYVSQNHCDNILEIGTHKGHTASGLIQYSRNKDMRYYGIDIFLSGWSDDIEKDETSIKPESLEQVRGFLNRYSKNIHLFEGFSKDVLPEIGKLGVKFDLIWIDGGHSYDTVKSDFLQSLELLNDNGIIFFDDYTSDPRLPGIGVKRFIDELIIEDEYDIKILNDYVDDYAGNLWRVASVEKRK